MDVLGGVNARCSHAVYECRVHGDKVLAEDMEAAVDSLYGSEMRTKGEEVDIESVSQETQVSFGVATYVVAHDGAK